MHVHARRLGAGLIATAAIGAAAIGLAGCGGSASADPAASTTPDPPATTASADAAVAVALGSPKELAMTVSGGAPAAGPVTFRVRTAGSMTHELVVIRTPRRAGNLPTTNGEASEAGSVGEVGDLAPGASKDLTLNLPAGHYALICNLPGHYAGGMYADFTVK